MNKTRRRKQRRRRKDWFQRLMDTTMVRMAAGRPVRQAMMSCDDFGNVEAVVVLQDGRSLSEHVWPEPKIEPSILSATDQTMLEEWTRELAASLTGVGAIKHEGRGGWHPAETGA